MSTDFKPAVGHKFEFRGKAGKDCDTDGVAFCEVLQIIPCKFLSYSWKAKGTDGTITVDSVVSWTLSEKNGGTELLFEHKGFSLEEDFLSHSKGWNSCVERLTQIINKKDHASSNA